MLADLVVVVHFAFIILIAAGGLLAWRWPWPWLIWIHVPAVAWGIGIVTVGWDCPLTGLEHELRDRAGESVNDGFIDRYVEGSSIQSGSREACGHSWLRPSSSAGWDSSSGDTTGRGPVQR